MSGSILHKFSCGVTPNSSRWQTTLPRGFVKRDFASVSQLSSDQKSVEQRHQVATIRLYRILQRSCRSFPVDNEDDPVLIQPPLKANDWGRHVVYKPPSPTKMEELFRLFYVMNDENEDDSTHDSLTIDDWYYEVVGKTSEQELPPMTSMTCWTSVPQLQEAIRNAFRVSYNFDRAYTPSLHKWAIQAAQLLQEQQLLWSNSSATTTEGVRVTATSRYDAAWFQIISPLPEVCRLCRLTTLLIFSPAA